MEAIKYHAPECSDEEARNLQFAPRCQSRAIRVEEGEENGQAEAVSDTVALGRCRRLKASGLAFLVLGGLAGAVIAPEQARGLYSRFSKMVGLQASMSDEMVCGAIYCKLGGTCCGEALCCGAGASCCPGNFGGAVCCGVNSTCCNGICCAPSGVCCNGICGAQGSLCVTNMLVAPPMEVTREQAKKYFGLDGNSDGGHGSAPFSSGGRDGEYVH
jgi:hypothetical protein